MAHSHRRGKRRRRRSIALLLDPRDSPHHVGIGERCDRAGRRNPADAIVRIIGDVKVAGCIERYVRRLANVAFARATVTRKAACPGRACKGRTAPRESIRRIV